MLGNLANLKMVLEFVVGNQEGLRLQELKHMMHPEGEQFISELKQVEASRSSPPTLLSPRAPTRPKSS